MGGARRVARVIAFISSLEGAPSKLRLGGRGFSSAECIRTGGEMAGGPGYRVHFHFRGCPVQAPLGRGFSLVECIRTVGRCQPAPSNARLRPQRKADSSPLKRFGMTRGLGWGRSSRFGIGPAVIVTDDLAGMAVIAETPEGPVV